jgi:hypothetical protein
LGVPAPKGAEKALLEAIERLRSGTPSNPGLKARAKAGKLKINATTATLEAGCARRLAYAYDRVRQALEIDGGDTSATGVEADLPRPKSLQEVVTHVRADRAEMKRERDLALSQSAALIVRLRQMERDVAREVRKAVRQAGRTQNGNQVAGNVHRLVGLSDEK